MVCDALWEGDYKRNGKLEWTLGMERVDRAQIAVGYFLSGTITLWTAATMKSVVVKIKWNGIVGP